MSSRAAQTVNRAALLGCGLLVAFLLLASPPAGADQNPQRDPDAGISIINGNATSINEWPWQVALTFNRRIAKSPLTSRRFFCGGSVLTPRLVITAGHCVADLDRRGVRAIEVVSGRTRLNSDRGQVAKVAGLRMPRTPNGYRRYKEILGAADWDVALLILRSPLTAKPIKLAGPDEAEAWSPGHVAWSTGWGVTQAFARRVPAELRVARQVLMPDGVCHRADGISFSAARMTCIGGPGGNSSTCNGDSGGPLVARTSDGYRLVGLTSYGDGACRGFVPSVDARVSGNSIRNWVATTAKNLTGRDVVGSGGMAEPTPEWCRVPTLFGLTVPKARKRLETAGCRLGKVRKDPWGAGRSGMVIGFARLPGWLASPGFKVNLWTAP